MHGGLAAITFNPDKGYRRSHIGPPPQPDKPAASLGDYCSAVLTWRSRARRSPIVSPVTPQPCGLAPAALSREIIVQRLDALNPRNRHEEVPPDEADHPSTLPLSLPLPGRPNLSSNRQWDCSSVKTRVRCRFPSPRMRATASLVLAYRMERGTPPKNATPRCGHRRTPRSSPPDRPSHTVCPP